MSSEYIVSLALLAGAVLKMFKVELESGVLEGLIAGVVALFLAIRRHSKGDITALGVRK